METDTETKSNCCATFIAHHRLGLLQEERFFNGLYFGLGNRESILHGNEPYWGIVYLQGPGIMIFDYSFGRRKEATDMKFPR
ncbi:hypothetical protein [Mucilaginibacter sp.]|uniref:hypothetical protein n=1 Tax=Mucilaginibacter sp. TaxID=1882438 RepID=UPI002622ABAC|nr:hypothetical protein [Mucilaginibacter sp.]MDB4922968.1 hypothetical protein [Mucilaginibacter sp.]